MKYFTKAVASDAVSARETANLDIAYRAACEGIVLLENDGALPLGVCKLALYGSGATKTIKGGTGSGEVNERHSVSIYEGLKDRGFEISSKSWISDFEAAYEQGLKDIDAAIRKSFRKLDIKKIVDLAFESHQYPCGRAITEADVAESETDVCVYVLSRQAGEGDDRKMLKGDYLVNDAELEHIRFCAKHYGRFILVINCGSPVDMGFMDEIEGINAVLFIAQLGTEGGHAVADILSGKHAPCGKLTDTWAKKYEDIPFSNEFSYLNGNLDDEYYKEGIYVGYRYFDSFKVAPRYEFGFGRSYTSFDVKPVSTAVDGTKVCVTAKITNIGTEHSGKEVAQLYISCPNGKLVKEYQSLAAFAKTDILQPGVTEELELCFDLADAASYSEADAAYILEAGEYCLRLGNSSRNTAPCAVLTLDGEVVISKHKHICPLKCKLEEIKAPEDAGEAYSEELKRIAISPEAFHTVEYKYETPAVIDDERVNKIMKGMSIKDMAEVVVGVGMFGTALKFNMPGSVGNTTDKFWKKGLSNVALCDGPAGLRIARRSAMNKKGDIKPLEAPISVFNYFPKFILKFMLGNEKKDTLLYQFTTAFPVAIALAQTWNVALLEELGKAVSVEMSEYGCTFWLAPAMNIHRNPLCGRNFEYFSEDPMLSGTMSRAITKGVQSREGHYAVVKHYACNNQEVNRNKVSSDLSERALREIYLRGFAIAIKNGGAKSVMTSYNRINGVYTPNSYDICTMVLRNEWGFDGVVMTDWYSTRPGQGDSALCMSAGNDLVMPGGGSYKRIIVRGVRSGKISKEDLRRCCANVVRSILDSETQKEYIK